jgi:fatty-acyl-CoA synthase
MGLNDGGIGRRPAAARISANEVWLRALTTTRAVAADPNRILSAVVDAHAEQNGDATALVSDGESLSYRALSGRANQYARWALGQGIGKGETVCLLMPNRPEFMACWLGVTKVGAVVSLLNTNLTGAALAHCIDIVAPMHVIVDARLIESFEAALPHLETIASVWVHGRCDRDYPLILDALATASESALDRAECRFTTTADLALCIYTSGTTGMPKAAKVSHYRVMMWSHWLAGMAGSQSTDRLYNCLPMYHSIGGVAAPGALMVSGGSVAIRERFSAHRFWDDIGDWDCTLFQYIGELCRYLVNSPPHPRETSHNIRLCCGNGLRPEVWNDFERRFRIPQILEFYASTEGNISLYNVEGKAGAIGRIPGFLAHRFPLALIGVDPETEQPIRNEQGSRFEGYTSERESEKKVLRNVFETGDAWFRTGDLMRKTADGYFYFVDRMGDTFRWKGENVATSEVAEAIAAFPGISDVTVYGVAISGHEGRAGMAALVVDEEIDLRAFRDHLGATLPSYARPLFLRFMPAIEVTATFKHMKVELMRQGCDPAATADPLFVDDPGQRAFVRLDQALFAAIQAGQLRL